MPKISIVVPVYNVEQYLEKCVHSLCNQTFLDFEIILVDDGSTDSSGDMCDNLAKTDSRITVLHKQNGGLSDARNFGIDAAQGEFLTFVDSDDYVAPTYLEYLLSLFDKSQNCLVTACNHTVVRNNSQKNAYDFAGECVFSQREAFEAVLYHDRLDVSAWAKLYRREVFETLRFPKGKLYEDTYIFGDVLNLTQNIVLGSKPQYFYIQRQNSIVNGGFSKQRLQFIDSVSRLCDMALLCDGTLNDACTRRMCHAYCSVLRYMDGCDKCFLDVRDELVKNIRKSAKTVLKDKKAPKRDKLAILSLTFGVGAFFAVWNFYSKLRG